MIFFSPFYLRSIDRSEAIASNLLGSYIVLFTRKAGNYHNGRDFVFYLLAAFFFLLWIDRKIMGQIVFRAVFKKITYFEFCCAPRACRGPSLFY